MKAGGKKYTRTTQSTRRMELNRPSAQSYDERAKHWSYIPRVVQLINDLIFELVPARCVTFLTFGPSNNDYVGLLDAERIPMTAWTNTPVIFFSLNRSSAFARCLIWTIVRTFWLFWAGGEQKTKWFQDFRHNSFLFYFFFAFLVAIRQLLDSWHTAPAHFVMVLVGNRCGLGEHDISFGKLGLLVPVFGPCWPSAFVQNCSSSCTSYVNIFFDVTNHFGAIVFENWELKLDKVVRHGNIQK